MPDHPRCKRYKSLHFLAKILAQAVPQSVWRAAYGASGVQAQLPPEVVFINRNEVHDFFSRIFFKVIHKLIVSDGYGDYPFRGGAGWNEVGGGGGGLDKQDK
jgi:hypothetical protein